MSYASAAIARQQILDHMNAQPLGYLASGPQIVAATGQSKSVWQACVKTMCAHGEMEKVGKGNAVRYGALAVKTIGADALKEKVNAKRAEIGSMQASNVSAKPCPKLGGGYYRHIAGHYDAPGHVQGRPLKNQGAQNSSMRRVYAGIAG